MKKSVFMLIILVLAQCLMGVAAMAQQQTDPCQSYVTVGLVPGLNPIGWTCQGWGDFVFLSNCWYDNANCHPPCNCGDKTAGSPIAIATGDTFIEETDVRIPGLSNGLTLVRTWRSQWATPGAAAGLFGSNWRSTYEEHVAWAYNIGIEKYMVYSRSDGTYWVFGYTTLGWVTVSPGNAGAILAQGTTYWTLTLKNGEQRRFDINSGSLTAIIDRNGNTTQLSYDGINRLVTVTDPASRTLTFTYPNNSSFLVTGVSSSAGISLTYAYDSQNRLSQVTKPDQTYITFQYDNNSNITSVLDSNGKVLESHTYDSNHRGLTSSRANGVEALTIAYQ